MKTFAGTQAGNQDRFRMEQGFGLQLTQEFLSDQVTFGVDEEVCDKSILIPVVWHTLNKMVMVH